MKRVSQEVFFGIPYGYPRLDKKEVMTLHVNLIGQGIISNPTHIIIGFPNIMEKNLFNWGDNLLGPNPNSFKNQTKGEQRTNKCQDRWVA
jgi:hypothetical protein